MPHVVNSFQNSNISSPTTSAVPAKIHFAGIEKNVNSKIGIIPHNIPPKEVSIDAALCLMTTVSFVQFNSGNFKLSKSPPMETKPEYNTGIKKVMTNSKRESLKKTPSKIVFMVKRGSTKIKLTAILLLSY